MERWGEGEGGGERGENHALVAVVPITLTVAAIISVSYVSAE